MLRVVAITCYLLVSVSSQAPAGAAAATSSLAGATAPPTVTPSSAASPAPNGAKCGAHDYCTIRLLSDYGFAARVFMLNL